MKEPIKTALAIVGAYTIAKAVYGLVKDSAELARLKKERNN